MRPRDVEVHIEELVLDGFAPGDHYRIGAAVQAELTRLLSGTGVSPSLKRGSEISQLDGGEFPVERGSGPETIGAQVARAVYAQAGFARAPEGRR